jgi:hypothetical protein
LQEDVVSEEISPDQALAKKRAEARLSQGRKLTDQLHTAHQEVRQTTVQLSEVIKRLVGAQREVTSHRGSLGRKRMEVTNMEAECLKLRQDMRSLELEQLRWESVQNDAQMEQIILQEAHIQKQTMAMDVMGRLARHLSESTEFGCNDIRQKVELQMEGSIAMDMARTAIQEPVAQVGLEEARLEAVRATLKQVKISLHFYQIKILTHSRS